MARNTHKPTTADPHESKQARIRRALLDPATKNLPSRAIARLCQVDERTVRGVRKAMGLETPPHRQIFVSNPPKDRKVNARSAGGKTGKRAK